MSYLDLLNGFNRWLESNALPTSAQLMYFKLLNVFNRAGWPASVRLDNHRLMSMTALSSPNAINAARSRLVEAGLIDYEQGKKGTPGKYTLRIPYDNHKISDKISDPVSCNHIKNKTKDKEEGVISTPAAFSSAGDEVPFIEELIRNYGFSDSPFTRKALSEDVQKTGTDRVQKAAEQAASSNKEAFVSIKFFRAFLYNNKDPCANLPWDNADPYRNFPVWD